MSPDRIKEWIDRDPRPEVVKRIYPIVGHMSAVKQAEIVAGLSLMDRWRLWRWEMDNPRPPNAHLGARDWARYPEDPYE